MSQISQIPKGLNFNQFYTAYMDAFRKDYPNSTAPKDSLISMFYDDYLQGQPVPIGFLRTQIDMLYKFASVRPDLTFYCTKIGTGIAGWGMELIAELFKNREHFRPSNIILPIEFSTK